MSQKFKNYLESFLILGLVLLLYYGLRSLDIIPDAAGIFDGISLWGVFMLGLVAAASTCIAVSGGMLLALSAKHSEMHPEAPLLEKFKPHLYFNLGRLLSYGFFGGAIGVLGSAISISPFANGLIIIVASVLMVALGSGMLKIFPRLYRLVPNFGRLVDLAPERGAFLGGAATFFLPCGFTQALQLYVLASGGGGLFGFRVMFVFALGTLPALISVGALSSVIKGKTQHYFFKSAGATVLLLGIFNLPNGLALMGFSYGAATVSETVAVSAGNIQTVTMKVMGLEYEPANFTIKKGIPVEWLIDGSGARGCARVLVAPKLGLKTYLQPTGLKKIKFIPEETGFIPFSCSMGMTTPGAGFRVTN